MKHCQRSLGILPNSLSLQDSSEESIDKRKPAWGRLSEKEKWTGEHIWFLMQSSFMEWQPEPSSDRWWCQAAYQGRRFQNELPWQENQVVWIADCIYDPDPPSLWTTANKWSIWISRLWSGRLRGWSSMALGWEWRHLRSGPTHSLPTDMSLHFCISASMGSNWCPLNSFFKF